MVLDAVGVLVLALAVVVHVVAVVGLDVPVDAELRIGHLELALADEGQKQRCRRLRAFVLIYEKWEMEIEITRIIKTVPMKTKRKTRYGKLEQSK